MTNEIQKTKSASDRFTGLVTKEFMSITGDVVKFDGDKKRLAQHLFIYADNQLKVLESDRVSKNMTAKAPIIWDNINLNKFALDAVHRIELGLDAGIQNHLFIIPYFNKKTKKYDVDLRIGYAGKDYYKREFSADKPVDIVYERVYENDIFEVVKRDMDHESDGYKFEIKKPFDRGKVVGGFGYIIYKNSEKNRLIIATEKDFLESMGLAQSDKFWKSFPDQMRYKTLVNIVTKNIQIDPKKVTQSFIQVERSEAIEAGEIAPELETIEIEAEKVTTVKDEAPKEQVEEFQESEPISEVEPPY